MKADQPVSQFCIYTMKRKSDLEKVYKKEKGQGTFIEHRKWATARRLFLQAQRQELKMPILFSAADVTSGLIYYAIVESIEIDEKEPGKTITKYKFSNLKRLESNPALSSLTLKSTSKRLSDNYIRPYAICYTPAFIMEASD